MGGSNEGEKEWGMAEDGYRKLTICHCIQFSSTKTIVCFVCVVKLNLESDHFIDWARNGRVRIANYIGILSLARRHVARIKCIMA